MVQQYNYSWKEQEISPTENLPPLALYAARDQKFIGMLTDATPHCGPVPGRTSLVLGWSVMTVKLVGRRKVSRVAP
jgi:hypothetical protein